MPDGPAGPGHGGGGAPHHPEGGPRVLERLDESECLQLIGGGRLRSLAYTGRFGPTALPVLCKLHEGPVSSTPSRTSSPRGPADRHLHAEYQVAFGGPPVRAETLEGWVVLVAGPGASCRYRGRARLEHQRRGPPRPELQPFEALGEDVRGDPGDLAGQVIEPLRPAGQRLDHQRRPPVTDLASARQAGTSRSPVQP
jgi:hypothetical protein